MGNTVYLALGSNIGDKEINLREAVELISRLEKTDLKGTSSIYETEPVGYNDQDNFLNMATMVDTGLNPIELLLKLQEIENILKRVRTIRWGPRTIDIDILLYGGERINLPQLQIPHPRMFERAFVLIPLSDIYQNDGLMKYNLKDLIEKCTDKDGVRFCKDF